MSNPTYVKDTAGRIFFVKETDDENLAHVWEGFEVKRLGEGYVSKKNARVVLVRKAGCKVLA